MLELTHRGFSAWIECENKHIPVFKPELDNARQRITCWIPSEPGEEFTIHWKDRGEGGGVDTASYIYLDGFMVPGKYLFGFGEASRGGVRVGPTAERPFVFGHVETDGNGPPQGRTNGKIVLKIKRVRKIPDLTRPSNKYQTPPDSPKGKRRAGHPYINYGEVRTTKKQWDFTYKYVPFDQANPGTYVTFEFRYATLDYLVNRGIISVSDLMAMNGPPAEVPIQQSTPPLTPSSKGSMFYNMFGPDHSPTSTDSDPNPNPKEYSFRGAKWNIKLDELAT